MSEQWQELAESLRTEIAEYGRIFQLFEEQQLCLFRRDANGTLRVSNEIEFQVARLEECRRERERVTSAIACGHGMPASSTVRSLLPHLAEAARPLLKALVGDVNRLVDRVRRISRHNRLFLLRTVETHREIINHFRPGVRQSTYAPNGRVAQAGVHRRQALAAEV